MKCTITKSVIYVIGVIWMPATTCAQEIVLNSWELENLLNEPGDNLREKIALWLDTHAGDFQSITDFQASLEIEGKTVDIDWENEDNEITYNDCMYDSDW